MTDKSLSSQFVPLLERDESFRLIVEGVQDYAIFLMSPTGHVLTWNRGAERIKGYKADEIIGQHFSRFYSQEARESGWPDRELQIASAEGRFTDEGWRVKKDGTLLVSDQCRGAATRPLKVTVLDPSRAKPRTHNSDDGPSGLPFSGMTLLISAPTALVVPPRTQRQTANVRTKLA